jgi:DNA-binding beta-propeller fold protein YncE
VGRRPSMFSRNYRRQIRKRRLKYIIAISTIGIVIIIMILSGGINSLTSSIKETMESAKMEEKNRNDLEDDKNAVIPEDNKDNETVEKDEIPEEKSKEETFDLNLYGDKNIKVTYLTENDTTTFKEVLGDETISFSISPSKNKIVVLDSTYQDLYLIDLNRNISKITKPEYVSTKKQVFKKDDILAQMNNYVWVEKPNFIDDTHIAYSSNLPWINNSGTRYLWIVDTQTAEHRSYTKVKGANFQFGELTPKGISLTIDNNTMYIDINGIVSM